MERGDEAVEQSRFDDGGEVDAEIWPVAGMSSDGPIVGTSAIGLSTGSSWKSAMRPTDMTSVSCILLHGTLTYLLQTTTLMSLRTDLLKIPNFH